MGRDRQRVLALLLVFAALVVASIFVMDWFVAEIGGVGKITLDLRSATMCQGEAMCVSVSLGYIKGSGSGFYPMFAAVTFWGTVLVAVCVVYQAGTKIIAGVSTPAVSRIGILGGLAMMACTVFTAYLFGPDVGSGQAAAISLSVERTWAPVLLLVAHLAGVLALHYSVVETLDDDTGIVVLPTATATATAAPARAPVAAPAVVEPVVAVPGASSPLPTFPDALRKQLQFVTVTAEVNRGGVDARREDGSTVLVMWRDVVGVVARRLPPELDGASFVDLVSDAGSTLRFLPWSRITGESIAGEGDGRVRSLIALVVERCPTVKLDPATRAFVEGSAAPAQLPDVETLAAHDARLA